MHVIVTKYILTFYVYEFILNGFYAHSWKQVTFSKKELVLNTHACLLTIINYYLEVCMKESEISHEAIA